jgi:6-aminohexanoate-oligomer endohydrolase
MDYKTKYLKYKDKYLKLKNNNQKGGGKKKQIKTNDNIKLKPNKSTSKHFIKLNFPDIIVSQCEYSEGPCGLTFIRCDDGFRVHKEIRGGWPGHIDCLSTNEKQTIYGINIAGGSLLGLESTTGLTAEGFKKMNYKDWPGYNGAIIYSGNLGHNKIYPDKELGRFAYNQSDKSLYSGQVGAGLSASHGQGWSYKEIEDIKVLALVVNNALGVVYKDNKVHHYPFGEENYLDNLEAGKNTTIIVVLTNLDLDSHDLKQMNQQLNVSIGETIRPFNTLTDGDIFYACSTKKIKKELNSFQRIKLFNEFSNVLKDAILNSCTV